MSQAGAAELADVLAEVRRIDIQTRRLVTGVMAGGYLSVFRGAGIEFESVREYSPGDDPRSVDWNVTARIGRPFVKTYVDERDLTVLFVLDLSASMGGGFGGWSARQTAARVCACLALSAARNGDRVGLVAFSDGVDAFVSPRAGSSHAWRIVRDCLALPAASPATRMAPALELVTRAVRRHAIVFVVSDFLSEDWQRPLAVCAQRHDVIAVRLLTPELTMPGQRLMQVRDPETGQATVIDWRSPRVRAAYAERVAAWRLRTEKQLRKAKVDRMDVPVPLEPGADHVAGPILSFFRMRELRGSKR
ncbi:MAG: DUF58 domain-containing protein [Planctomycetota bacterium]|nr:DUF58 domain-containing protein [Planctomycetota bacterium]